MQAQAAAMAAANVPSFMVFLPQLLLRADRTKRAAPFDVLLSLSMNIVAFSFPIGGKSESKADPKVGFAALRLQQQDGSKARTFRTDERSSYSIIACVSKQSCFGAMDVTTSGPG
jgi:hypothetical protein